MNLATAIQIHAANGVYYARPCVRMGTSREVRDMHVIKDHVGKKVKIRAPKNKLGPKKAKKKDMEYFFKKVDRSKSVIGSPRYGKRVTTGVFAEMQHGLHHGKKVYLIYKGELRRVRKMRVLKKPNPKGSFAEAVLYKKRKK